MIRTRPCALAAVLSFATWGCASSSAPEPETGPVAAEDASPETRQLLGGTPNGSWESTGNSSSTS